MENEHQQIAFGTFCNEIIKPIQKNLTKIGDSSQWDFITENTRYNNDFEMRGNENIFCARCEDAVEKGAFDFEKVLSRQNETDSYFACDESHRSYKHESQRYNATKNEMAGELCKNLQNDKLIRDIEKERENIQKEKKDIGKLALELENTLRISDVEEGEFLSAKCKIISIENEYSMRIVGETIQTVYVNNFDRPNFLIGICESLLRYDLKEVMPWGLVILSGILNHRDESVIEHAVNLIDNWEGERILPILRGLRVQSEWLQEYISEVIARLEKTDVLHEKIITR